MRSHFQSQAANKMFCWLCKCQWCVNDFIIVLNHAISCIKTWRWGWDRSGAKTNNVQWLFYVNIWLSVKFWNADVCQNAIKLSCVDMKRKRKNLFLFCIRKEWYADIRHVLLMRSLFCVFATKSFLSLMVLLSMYFGTMYDDCCSVTSDLTSQILFLTSPMDDCFLKSQHPKMYKSLIYKVAWSSESERGLLLFMSYDMIFDLKTMSNWFLFVNSIPTHHDDNFCYWNTLWEGRIKIFYIQNSMAESMDQFIMWMWSVFCNIQLYIVFYHRRVLMPVSIVMLKVVAETGLFI